jgi:hypothetical protein
MRPFLSKCETVRGPSQLSTLNSQLSTLNLSTSQPLNLSTSQPLNLSTSQPLPNSHKLPLALWERVGVREVAPCYHAENVEKQWIIDGPFRGEQRAVGSSLTPAPLPEGEGF